MPEGRPLSSLLVACAGCEEIRERDVLVCCHYLPVQNKAWGPTLSFSSSSFAYLYLHLSCSSSEL